MPTSYRGPKRRDVAQRAGVSETIVSYVLNGRRYVDADKRRRVEEAVKELNYRPNTLARAMKGKRTRHFVLIADQISNEHFSLLYSEMEEAAYQLGYMISLCATSNDERFLAELLSRQYDGIIISSLTFASEYIRRLMDWQLPLILLRSRAYPDYPQVVQIDTGLYEGARLAADYLQRAGAGQLLYLDRVSRQGRFSGPDDLRWMGFCRALGLDPGAVESRSWMLSGCSDEEELALRLLAELRQRRAAGQRLGGIVARNDQLACTAIQALQSAGYQVPDEVQVIGFDDARLGRYMQPALSSVHLDRRGIAQAAVRALHGQLEGERASEHCFYFQPELRIRGSTRPIATEAGPEERSNEEPEQKRGGRPC